MAWTIDHGAREAMSGWIVTAKVHELRRGPVADSAVKMPHASINNSLGLSDLESCTGELCWGLALQLPNTYSKARTR